MADQHYVQSELTREIIGAAIEVHRELGAGLLESAYQICLAHLLRENGLKVETEVRVPLKFRGIELDCDYRLDLLVENAVIVEAKAVEALTPLHEAQLLTYLRLTEPRVGLLMNFHVPVLKDGIRRLIV